MTLLSASQNQTSRLTRLDVSQVREPESSQTCLPQGNESIIPDNDKNMDNMMDRLMMINVLLRWSNVEHAWSSEANVPRSVLTRR